MRTVLQALTTATIFTACASVGTGGAVDHSFEVRNVGKTKITELEYAYGDLPVRTLRQLGAGGDGRTQVMPIPVSARFKWTTPEDNRRHEVSIPVASLNLGTVDRRIVTFDFNGPELSLFVDYINPATFVRERRFVQTYRTP